MSQHGITMADIEAALAHTVGSPTYQNGTVKVYGASRRRTMMVVLSDDRERIITVAWR